MKLLTVFGKFQKKEKKQTESDNQREVLIKMGREQFKQLIDRGLGVPVALL